MTPSLLKRTVERGIRVPARDCSRTHPDRSRRCSLGRCPATDGPPGRASGRQRPVSDPLRRGGAAAGAAGRLRGHQVRGPRRAGALCARRFDVVGVAKLGKMIRTFRRRDVRQIVMAGKVTKNVMYTPWRMVQLCPDLRTLQWWYRRSRADNRDDSLLLSVIAEFERDGMTFASALDYCPELLVKEGVLTRRAPTAAERQDIEFGWTLAKEMGRLDVGQSVAVKEKATLAVEAIEGTDRCIDRAGHFAGPAAGRWSRSPSPSRTCGSTCRPSA